MASVALLLHGCTGNLSYIAFNDNNGLAFKVLFFSFNKTV